MKQLRLLLCIVGFCLIFSSSLVSAEPDSRFVDIESFYCTAYFQDGHEENFGLHTKILTDHLAQSLKNRLSSIQITGASFLECMEKLWKVDIEKVGFIFLRVWVVGTSDYPVICHLKMEIDIGGDTAWTHEALFFGPKRAYPNIIKAKTIDLVEKFVTDFARVRGKT